MKSANAVKSYAGALSRNRLILAVCAVFLCKIILAGIFSSDYQDLMFLPFVNQFLDGIGTSDWNVYQYYYENNLIYAFPYPPLLLLIESFGGLLLRAFPSMTAGNIFLTNLFFKVPLLFFDLLGLYFLFRMFPSKRHYAAVLYYCSPIILYGCIMHGQLDIISTVLLLGALYYLQRAGGHRVIRSALLFSAAFLCKTHVIAVFPFVALYIWHKWGIKKTLQYILIFLVAACAVILPFWSEGLLERVFLNNEQMGLFQFSIEVGSTNLYVTVFAVLFVYLVAMKVRTFNDDLLVSMCGITFAIILSLCRPYTGWYVWVVPYIVMFFIMVPNEKYANIVVYVLLNALDLIYFVFLHRTDYVDLIALGHGLERIKMGNEFAASMVFTFMSAVMLYFACQMYSHNISENPFYKRKGKPFMVGVSGDSGSGKTTFVEVMTKTLGEGQIQRLDGDGDHRWERGDSMWNVLTHLNPDANYLYRQAQDLIDLKNESSISRRDYDHSIGHFTKPKKVRAKKYIFLCGLHSLYLPQTRECLDLKVYMDADEDLRRYWKIHRDTGNRGQEADEVIAKIEARMPDAEKYIYPQKQYADIVIRYFDDEIDEFTDSSHEVVMSAQVSLNAGLNLEPLIKELSGFGVFVRKEYSPDLTKQVITIDGRTLADKLIDFNAIGIKLNPNLDEITVENLKYEENLQGILAMITLLFMDGRIRGNIS